MASLADAAVSRFFSEPFRATSPEVVAAFRRVLSETAAGGYAGCCAALRDADLRAEIGRISAPTLVIAGSLDASTPPDQGDELARGVADGRLTVVDAAHLSNIERPDDFTAALRGHLEII
jgi:3-oxoadipate enol-lactonase